MSSKVAHFKRVIAAEIVHQWKQLIHENPYTKPFFYKSTASFSSSSSRKSASLPNFYLRKARKWPFKPNNTHYDQTFAYQLAMRSFKQSIKKSRTHLLSTLINSFATYEIDPTPQAYKFLFKIITQKHPFNQQIPQILHHIEKVENFETPECIFIDLINYYGDNCMFTEAVELFFRIPKFRCDPTVETFNALLSVLCSNEKGFKFVPQILIKSQEMNVMFEESSYGILIRALCKIGKVSNAFQLLCNMVDEGFSVDQKVCSLLLATKCRQQDVNGNEIMGFLGSMKRFGFEPRKNDLCNLIRCLVRNGFVINALEVLKQMKVNGTEPDIMSYNLVLDGLVFKRDFLNADKVFDELLILGLVPDITTYNVYLSGLCMQKKFEDVMKMMVSMEELGCAPNLNTYNTTLRALCEAGELDRVREVLYAMRKKRVELISETNEIKIDGLISNGDVDGACSLLNEIFKNESSSWL